MHRVQAHIDRHLDQPLDLEALAAVAHFSPFHFHRLFLAWTGQTLGGYLARRRLEKAAQRLRGQPDSTVLSIALSVGYGSAEAFTRAFKLHFGLPPTQWRNLDQADGIGHDDPSLVPPEQCRYDCGVVVPPDWVPNGGALVTELPGGRYAALDFEGTAADIGSAWQAMMGRWLPSSGLQLDARPCFEHYGPAAKFDFRTGVFDCELCIPVAPL